MISRRSARIPLQAAISVSGEGGTSEGTLINLSTGGCAVETETLYQKGDYLGVRVHIRDHEPPVEVELAAVRWASGRECGLEFIRIRDEVQQQLRELLEIT